MIVTFYVSKVHQNVFSPINVQGYFRYTITKSPLIIHKIADRHAAETEPQRQASLSYNNVSM